MSSRSTDDDLFRDARDLLRAAEIGLAQSDGVTAYRFGFACQQHSLTRGDDPCMPDELREKYRLKEKDLERAIYVCDCATQIIGEDKMEEIIGEVNYGLGLEGDGPNVCRDRFTPDGKPMQKPQAGPCFFVNDAAAPAWMDLKDELIGTAIEIRGLQTKPELNGAKAKVLHRVTESGRYAVRVTALPDGTAPEKTLQMKLKSQNLVLKSDR